MTPESHDNKSVDFSKLYKNVSHCLCFVKFRIIHTQNRIWILAVLYMYNIE